MLSLLLLLLFLLFCGGGGHRNSGDGAGVGGGIVATVAVYCIVVKYCRINKKREKSTLSASFHVFFL